jgi:signal transduction histidine kinase
MSPLTVAPAPLDYSIQPYSGTDLVALVLGIAALHCLTIRLREHEAGLGWIAAGMAGLAAWVGANRLHLPSGPQLNASPWYYLMCLAMVATAVGLVRYLDVPARLRRWTLGLVFGSAFAFAAMVTVVALTGWVVLRAWTHVFTAVVFISLGVLTLAAARREPGAGHGWLALVLFLVPGLALALALTGSDPVALRYWAVLPVMLLGLTLPTVSVMRRQHALRAEVARRTSAERALEAVNSDLEAKVAERTADLQDMVAGLESFNRNVSHDLRGPLGGIAALARMAEQGLEKGNERLVREALPAIVKQAEYSTELVASLLELARVSDVQLARQPVDPAVVAREVIDGLLLKRDIEPLPRFVIGALPMVEVDPALLRAVLSNLIGNAVKFTRDRHDGQVEIAARPTNGHVCLQVRDNGIGFDPQAAAAVFAPFRRLHDATYAGHGIGLSIVRRAVERHGGKVWAEAAPGEGACFSFTLPRAS